MADRELERSGYSIIEETQHYVVFLYKGNVYIRLPNSNTWLVNKSADGGWVPVRWAGHWIGRIIFKTSRSMNLCETIYE